MEIIFEKPTIGKFLSFCETNPDVVVNVKPGGCGSWRGIYAEACIYCNFYEEAKLGEFIPYLQELVSGKEFYGYKGGEYYYCRSTELNFEGSPSYYTEEGNLEKFLKDDYVEVDQYLLQLFIKHFNLSGG